MNHSHSMSMSITIIVVALLAIALIGNLTMPKQEYVIPGTISATCGPTLPEYTYCP
jgi:hypothetical protein